MIYRLWSIYRGKVTFRPRGVEGKWDNLHRKVMSEVINILDDQDLLYIKLPSVDVALSNMIYRHISDPIQDACIIVVERVTKAEVNKWKQ